MNKTFLRGIEVDAGVLHLFSAALALSFAKCAIAIASAT